jgi:hypothetical protein
MKEGFMDSEVMGIQTDLTAQKTILDKKTTSMNVLLEKDVADKFDMQPIMEKIIKKLKALDLEKKDEHKELIKELKALQVKTEELTPYMDKYRNEVKKFSDTKLGGSIMVKDFLPTTQTFVAGLQKDIEKILKD